MPTRPANPCVQPRCSHLQPCPTHGVRKPFATARRSSSLYDTAQWKRVRRAHLDLEPYCRACRLEGLYVAATTVDHEPPHRGDEVAFWDGRRFVAMCSRHHNAKTGRETRERVKA